MTGGLGAGMCLSAAWEGSLLDTNWFVAGRQESGLPAHCVPGRRAPSSLVSSWQYPTATRTLIRRGSPVPRHTLCPLPQVSPAMGHWHTARPPQVLSPCWHRHQHGHGHAWNRTPSSAPRALCQSDMSQHYPPIALPLLQSSPVLPVVQSQYRLTLYHCGGAVPVAPSVTFPTALALSQYIPGAVPVIPVYPSTTQCCPQRYPTPVHWRPKGAGGSTGVPWAP